MSPERYAAAVARERTLGRLYVTEASRRLRAELWPDRWFDPIDEADVRARLGILAEYEGDRRLLRRKVDTVHLPDP